MKQVWKSMGCPEICGSLNHDEFIGTIFIKIGGDLGGAQTAWSLGRRLHSLTMGPGGAGGPPRRRALPAAYIGGGVPKSMSLCIDYDQKSEDVVIMMAFLLKINISMS